MDKILHGRLIVIRDGTANEGEYFTNMYVRMGGVRGRVKGY